MTKRTNHSSQTVGVETTKRNTCVTPPGVPLRDTYDVEVAACTLAQDRCQMLLLQVEFFYILTHFRGKL